MDIPAPDGQLKPELVEPSREGSFLALFAAIILLVAFIANWAGGS